MRRGSNFEQWKPNILPRGSILVTTHSGLSTTLSDLGTSSDEEKEDVDNPIPEFLPPISKSTRENG